jgi:pectate lyase
MSAAGSAGHAGASAATGKLYADDFEAGSLTMPSWIDADPELGGKWMIVAADGGKALAQTASVSDWVIAAGGDYRWTDQVVQARVQITSDPGKAGIFARLRDTRNYYFLYLDGGSNLVLRKRVDNSSDDVQKVKVETQANTWYTLKLSVIGDQLQGYLDGKMMVSGSDDGISAGGIGVGTSDCTAEFDDVVVNGS